jgi:hypothetical protein
LDDGLNRDWGKFELRGILKGTGDPSIDFSQIAWSAPVEAFSDDSFSPQQLQILQSLVNRYHAAHFLDVDLSEDHGAWESTWFHGRGKGARIPFELTLPVNDPMTPEILELQKQEQSRLAAHRELMRAGGHAA